MLWQGCGVYTLAALRLLMTEADKSYRTTLCHCCLCLQLYRRARSECLGWALKSPMCDHSEMLCLGAWL